MSVTYSLLQMPPTLLFLITVILGGSIAGMGTYFFRKYIRIRVLRSHNEVTGFAFLALAGFYSLLMSFIVFMVWNQLNQTRGNASMEGSSAMGLYRDIKYYPDTVESKQLMAVYLDFVYNVIDKEWPDMEHMQPGRKTSESFNKVFYTMEHLNPKNPFQVQLVAEMFNHLNSLATYRGLRANGMESEIPAPMWLPILLGALLTIVCSMLLDIEHMKVHVILNSMLGMFVGMFLFIIITLDHPFTGSLGIKPHSYKQIFTMEQWDSELHAKKITEIPGKQFN